jgi:hypothetical protein
MMYHDFRLHVYQVLHDTLIQKHFALMLLANKKFFSFALVKVNVWGIFLAGLGNGLSAILFQLFSLQSFFPSWRSLSELYKWGFDASTSRLCKQWWILRFPLAIESESRQFDKKTASFSSLPPPNKQTNTEKKLFPFPCALYGLISDESMSLGRFFGVFRFLVCLSLPLAWVHNHNSERDWRRMTTNLFSLSHASQKELSTLKGEKLN